jgi:flavin reductase (DIM6/NTAB) family NADH-FMN oxidoreductase RutF
MEVNDMSKKEISLKRPEEVPEDAKLRWPWTQFPLPTPLVIVTTVDEGGKGNAAPKNAIMPFLNEPDMVAFMCKMSHDTAKNILETNEFTISIPSIGIMKQVMGMGAPLPRGKNEIEHVGLTSEKGIQNNAPLVKECKVHTECKLEWYKEIGLRDDVLFVGKMRNIIMDEELIGLPCSKRIEMLKMIIIWPDGFSAIEKSNDFR